MLSTPRRPSIPLFLLFALCLWAALALVMSCAQGWSQQLCTVFALCAVFVSLFMTWLLFHSKRKHLALVLLSCCLGLLLGSVASLQYQTRAENVAGVWGSFEIELLSDTSNSTYGKACRAQAVYTDGRVYSVRIVFDDDQTHRFGEHATVQGYLKTPSEVVKDYCWQQGIDAQLCVSQFYESESLGAKAACISLRNRAIDEMAAYSSYDKGLSAALLCGYRESLDEDLYRSFQVCGLAHVVAVSGAHLSIVVAFLNMTLRRLRLARRWVMVIQLLFILGYLVFTAIPLSAVRASVMVILALVAPSVHRRSSSLNALALCIVVFLVLDPFASLSVSLALSALSTLGIILFGRLFSYHLSKLAFVPQMASDALALTFASSLLTVPLSASLFSQVPLISPIANALAVPLFAPVCVIGLLSLTLSFATAGLLGFSLIASSICAGFMAQVVTLVSQVPFASIPASVDMYTSLVLSCVLSYLLWHIWPLRFSRRLVKPSLIACSITALLVFFGAWTNAQLDEIRMLDVGQGDAFLLRSKGVNVLVDTGNQKSMLFEALSRAQVYHLSAVIISHSDDDHMGCLRDLKGRVAVDKVLISEGTLSCECENCATLRSDARYLVGDEGIVAVEEGYSLSWGDFSCSVIWPYQFNDEGGNGDSLCFKLSADYDSDGSLDFNALFVGDAEAEQLTQLEELGKLSGVDVLKVGHHGSKNALNGQLVTTLSPQIALISVGESNSYGHPNKATLSLLNTVNSMVYRSDRQGDVSCILERGSIRVHTLS